MKSTWVINISNKKLIVDQENVLRYGLNCAVTPRKSPTDEYIVGIEQAPRALGPYGKEAETLRAQCVCILKNAPLPKPNLKKET